MIQLKSKQLRRPCRAREPGGTHGNLVAAPYPTTVKSELDMAGVHASQQYETRETVYWRGCHDGMIRGEWSKTE